MDINTLQKAIDENRLNVTQLNNDQRALIDQALEQGILTGPKNTQEIEDKIYVARDYLAAESEAAVDPKQGEGRDYAVLGGEVAAYFTYMGINNKRLKKDIEKYGTRFGTKAPQRVRDKVALETKTTAQNLGKVFKGFGKGRLGKVFSFTTGFLDKLSLGLLPALSRAPAKAKVIQKYGLTEATKAELKALSFVAPTGAVVGGGLYDLDNFNKSLGITSQLDLKDFSKREFDRMTVPERILTRAVDDYTQALAWGLGTQGFLSYGLIPLGKSTAKFLTGTGGKVAEDRLRFAVKSGTENVLSLTSLADTSKALGKVTSAWGKTFGLLPGAVGKYEKKFLESTEALTEKFFENISLLAPVQHSNLFGYQLRNVMAENFKENYRMIDQMYDNVKKAITEYDTLKDAKVIPIRNTIEAAGKASQEFSAIRGKVLKEADAVDIREILNAMGDQTATRQLASVLEAMGRRGEAYITADEYFQFGKLVNKIITEEGGNISRKQFNSLVDMHFAFEKDLRFYDLGDQAFREVSEKAGVSAANMDQFRVDIASFHNSLKMADGFFSASVLPFNHAMMAKALKAQDSELFTNFTLFDISGSEKVTPAGMFNHLQKVVFRSQDPEAVVQFASMLGAKNPAKVKPLLKGQYDLREIGQEAMRRMTSRHLFDSYMSAFQNSPVAKTQSIQEMIARAKKAGVTDYKGFDENPAFVRGMRENPAANDFSTARSFKPDAISKMDDRITYKELDFNAQDAGDFNITTFKNNLGLDSEGGDAALKEMFLAGGLTNRQATEQVDALKSLVKIIEMHQGVKPGETSSFLTRKVGLSGLSGVLDPGKLLVGAGSLGTVGLPGTILAAVVLRKLGAVIGDPKAARALLDIASPEQRVKDIESTYIMDYVMPRKRASAGYLLEKVFGAPPGLEEKEADKPSKVDVNKITFSDISKLLNEGPVFVPDTDFDYDDLSPGLQRRMFPDIYRRRLLPPEVQEAYKDLLIQKQKKLNEYRQEEQAPAPQPQEPSLTEPENVPISPSPSPQPQPQPTTAPGDTMTFQSIFPDDPIGSLIAQRQEREKQS